MIQYTERSGYGFSTVKSAQHKYSLLGVQAHLNEKINVFIENITLNLSFTSKMKKHIDWINYPGRFLIDGHFEPSHRIAFLSIHFISHVRSQTIWQNYILKKYIFIKNEALWRCSFTTFIAALTLICLYLHHTFISSWNYQPIYHNQVSLHKTFWLYFFIIISIYSKFTPISEPDYQFEVIVSYFAIVMKNINPSETKRSHTCRLWDVSSYFWLLSSHSN